MWNHIGPIFHDQYWPSLGQCFTPMLVQCVNQYKTNVGSRYWANILCYLGDIGRITHSDVPTCTLRHSYMKTLDIQTCRYLNVKTLDIRTARLRHATTLRHSNVKTLDIGRITHSDVPTCTLRHSYMKTLDIQTLRYLNVKTLDIRTARLRHATTFRH